MSMVSCYFGAFHVTFLLCRLLIISVHHHIYLINVLGGMIQLITIPLNLDDRCGSSRRSARRDLILQPAFMLFGWRGPLDWIAFTNALTMKYPHGSAHQSSSGIYNIIQTLISNNSESIKDLNPRQEASIVSQYV